MNLQTDKKGSSSAVLLLFLAEDGLVVLEFGWSLLLCDDDCGKAPAGMGADPADRSLKHA